MELHKIALLVSYDGTSYAGFQRQQNLPTIQSVLEQALSTMANEPIQIVGSGRTDAGVHAYGQVVHFETSLNIPIKKWPLAIKAYLPEDIIIRAAYQVSSNFHARYDAIGKTYHYHIDRGLIPHVFRRRYSYHYPHSLDLDLMNQAAKLLIGTHDFSAFCVSGSSVENHVRTLYEIGIREEAEQLILSFYGNGFLYKMVRTLVGTLLVVGNEKMAVDEIPNIIAGKDRKKAGVTAPAHGLVLYQVEYPAEKLALES